MEQELNQTSLKGQGRNSVFYLCRNLCMATHVVTKEAQQWVFCMEFHFPDQQDNSHQVNRSKMDNLKSFIAFQMGKYKIIMSDHHRISQGCGGADMS